MLGNKLINTEKGRLIAIGDIHGHSDALKALLIAIEPQPEDNFVFLGDYVDRGPDTKGVIDQIIELKTKTNVFCVLGNHEEMILAAYQGGKAEHKFWCKFGGNEAMASYGIENVKNIPGNHLLFIADCKDYFESEHYIFVHAHCNPLEIDISKNKGDTLRWDLLPKLLVEHITGKTIICGHTCQKEIYSHNGTICIDTGCGVFPNGKLTAIDLKTNKIWQCYATKS